jgi:predicted DNA-binding protein
MIQKGESMIRTQIQLTPEQARALKRLSIKEGKSVAELIRISIENMLKSGGIQDQEVLRQKAANVSGKLHGPENLAADHDHFLVEAIDR